ncbi:hypothetical protein [Lentilactobacillus senioris]|uniref:hypothetical protein n=1 Tax=Lentilactobacillus senioris TaxID=931534 RepID=UPI003D2CAEBF
MLKDNAFMTAYHKAEELYGPNVAKWPENSSIIFQLRNLSADKDPSKKLALNKHPNNSSLLLINYANPGVVLAKYSSVAEAAEKNGVSIKTAKMWRYNLTKGYMGDHHHNKVLIYEGEKALMSQKPKGVNNAN